MLFKGQLQCDKYTYMNFLPVSLIISLRWISGIITGLDFLRLLIHTDKEISKKTMPTYTPDSTTPVQAFPDLPQH